MIFRPSSRREGAVLPQVALCLVALVGMLALAIDIGLIAVARTHSQNAADAAAMTGARTINGDVTQGYNLAAVPGNALTTARTNNILGEPVDTDPGNPSAVNEYTWKSGDVTIEVGSYTYEYNDANPSDEGFHVDFPRSSATEPYSAVRATVEGQGKLAFAPIFGATTFNTRAVAVAAHRPRDVMIILDLSGSMRFQSLPGTPMSGSRAAPSSTSIARTRSLNPDGVFPRFGHYADTAGAALQGTVGYETTTGEFVDPSNITVESDSGPPIVLDFHQNPVGTAPSSGTLAFSPAPPSYDAAPGGDLPLKYNLDTSSNYARTVRDFNNSSSNVNPEFELKGYKAVRSQFHGYTQGPNYWGKTFWAWPPSPCGEEIMAPPSSLTATGYAWHDNKSLDWRQRFFVGVRTSPTPQVPTWITHNTILFNPVGTTPAMKKPGDVTTVTENGSSVSYTFRINYAAILYWLNQGPAPFPPTLQAGRIRYYTAMPNGTDTTLNNRWWTTNPTSLPANERFWKEYIDFVLGYEPTGTNTYANTQGSVPISALIGNGDYFTPSGHSLQISARPQPQPPNSTPGAPYQTGTVYTAASSGATTLRVSLSTRPTANSHFVVVNNDSANPRLITGVSGTSSPYFLTLASGLDSSAPAGVSVKVYSPYMNYSDNVPRPRHQYWFGPMTLIDWLGNYNFSSLSGNASHHWWPGNCHEAQGWACKAGIQTAIDDIRKNHPNDFVGLAFFSTPKTSNGGTGYHNRAIVPLGRSYQQLIDSLWFPPSTVTGGATEIGPYDADMSQVPRANGGTGPGMGFMIAYNQFSSSATNLRNYAQPASLYRGSAGGMGRKGAERLVIFETDGAPNSKAVANLEGSGGDSYYRIRIQKPADLSDSMNNEWPSSSGGYSNTDVYNVVSQIVALETSAQPGYGTLRKPAKVYCIGYGAIYDPANAGTTQTNGLTFLQSVQYYGNTSKDTNPSNFPQTQRIYGDSETRIANMQKAISDIMQSGVQVSLIR